MPKITDVTKPEWNRKPATATGDPRVSIIVPARDEEETIAETLRRLLTLDYDNFEIIAVNDRSTDRTGTIMASAAASPASLERLRVIHIQELPEGWLGKTHAMWTAGEQATGDWLLFTDADVLFKPDSLRRLAIEHVQVVEHNTATSLLTPATSSLTRISIGWLKPNLHARDVLVESACPSPRSGRRGSGPAATRPAA